MDVAEHAVHHQEKLQRHLSLLTELSSPTAPQIYLGGNNLVRTLAHSTLGDSKGLAPINHTIDRLHTVHEGAWTSDPNLINSPEEDWQEASFREGIKGRALPRRLSG